MSDLQNPGSVQEVDEGVEIVRTGELGTARWRWSGGHEAQLFLSGLTSILMPVLMYFTAGKMVEPGDEATFGLLGVVFALVGIGCLCFSFLGYVNSTELQVSADLIKVRHKPFYPFSPTVFRVRVLRRVWIEVRETSIGSGGRNPPSFSTGRSRPQSSNKGMVSRAKNVAVRGETVGGETVTIATGLRSELAGNTVAKLIEAFLPGEGR